MSSPRTRYVKPILMPGGFCEAVDPKFAGSCGREPKANLLGQNPERREDYGRI